MLKHMLETYLQAVKLRLTFEISEISVVLD